MGIFDKMFKRGAKDDAAPAVDKSVLLDKIRQSELFSNLPSENIEEMFNHMESEKLKAGETIIQQGEEGDYYYLLVSGKADVKRLSKGDSEPQVVAELKEPTGFGEEALISNAKRNATVVMTAAGEVMKLSKDDFDDYVKDPMITWVSPADAQKMISEGAKWIDVRPPEESKASHLHGALLIPLEDIRDRLAELDKEQQYICYCEKGRQSSTAAFLLSQKGYKASVLRGGIQSLKRAGIA